MAEIIVVPLADGRTRITHPGSGSSIVTDSSPEWGGRGRGFSATDLVAAALGACIGSSIAPVLERRGVDVEHVTIRVTKTLATDPKRISHLHTTITLPNDTEPGVRSIVERAASACAVGRSLGCTHDLAVI